MCPKTSKTTPLLLIAGICFVIILVGITGITLINNINLSNIIRLNEKVASDSVSNNENQIKELNYVNNHPRNVYLKLNGSSGDSEEEKMQKEQELQEQLELPKISAVIGGRKLKVRDNQLKESSEAISEQPSPAPALPSHPSSGDLTSLPSSGDPSPLPTSGEPTISPPSYAVEDEHSPPLPFGGVKYNASSGLIDYEKRNQVVKVSQGLRAVCCPLPAAHLTG